MVAVVGWHLATADREICTEEGGRRNCTPYTPEERRLHVVDLVSWTEKVVPAGMTEFYLPTFSEDNTGLYVIFMDPSSNKPLTHRLHRYDPNTERLSLVAELPIGFNPLEMRLLPSGDRLAMYGALGGIGATAHVVIVDVGQGRVLADVTLEGVRHGFVVSGEPAEGGTPLRDYSAGLAWDLDRERLYVVHADTDRVTVVDLAQGKLLKQANIIHPQSPLSRMLDWVSRPAYAKEAPGITRRVVLIPDGDRLYVTGTEGVWDKDTKAVVEQPLGLQIIATDDFRQLRRLDLPVSDIDLSPNGKWLLLGSSIQGNPNVPPSGLSVFDAQSMTEVAHLEPGLHVRVLGLSADGRYVYVSARSIGTGWKGDTMVKVLDLLSLEFKGTRSLGGFNPDQPLIGAQ
ncbi:MAG: hypothetical protein FJ320_04775 [SAR202 cluster bacterium]|nr:hypothetical protein [SAR202 cluster bacterium]